MEIVLQLVIHDCYPHNPSILNSSQNWGGRGMIPGHTHRKYGRALTYSEEVKTNKNATETVQQVRNA